MDIVLNDFSIDGQFESSEDFLDYLTESLFSVLEQLAKQGCILLKSHYTYSRCIVPGITLHDMVFHGNFNGYSEITKLRAFIVQLTDEPFWETDQKTQTDALYDSPVTGNFSGDSPNCLSEAYERGCMLMSFRHNAFSRPTIKISKDSVTNELDNITDRYVLADCLVRKDRMTLAGLLEVYGKESDIIFPQHGGSGCYYVDEGVEEKLTCKDKLQIKGDFIMFIEGKATGQMLRRLTDTVVYKGERIHEFRTTVSNSREFRIYYYKQGSRWICLYGWLKDKQTMPDHIKQIVYDRIRAL